MPPQTQPAATASRCTTRRAGCGVATVCVALLLAATALFGVVDMAPRPAVATPTRATTGAKPTTTTPVLQTFLPRATSPAAATQQPPPRTVAPALHAAPVAHVTEEDAAHEHAGHTPADCDAVAGLPLLRTWRGSVRLVCRADALEGFKATVADPAAPNVSDHAPHDVASTTVHEYRLQPYQFEPTVRVFRNVAVNGALRGGIFNPGCDEGTTRVSVEANGNVRQEKPYWAGPAAGWPGLHEAMQRGGAHALADGIAKDVATGRVVVFRLGRFDPDNFYEAFHAYLNSFATAAMLNVSLDNIQFVFVDGHPLIRNDHDFWTAMAGGREPMREFQFDHGQGPPALVHTLIEGSSSGTSMLRTQAGPLPGAGTPHHCKSTVLRRMVTHMRLRFNVTQTGPDAARPVVILSVRRPYLRRGNAYTPQRVIAHEDEFLRNVTDALGPQHYDVRIVDFANTTMADAARLVSCALALVGVHGAGLMWAAFLPRHALLVEIFGGNRGPANQHYHNIAALSDVHYADTTFNLGILGRGRPSSHVMRRLETDVRTGPNGALPWSHEYVHDIVSAIAAARAGRAKEPNE